MWAAARQFCGLQDGARGMDFCSSPFPPPFSLSVQAVTDVLDDAREDEGISSKQHAALSSAMATALQDKLDPNN